MSLYAVYSLPPQLFCGSHKMITAVIWASFRPMVAHRAPFTWPFLPPPWHVNQLTGSSGCGSILLQGVILSSRQLLDKMDMAFPTFLPKTSGDSITVKILCLAVKGIKCMGASLPKDLFCLSNSVKTDHKGMLL